MAALSQTKKAAAEWGAEGALIGAVRWNESLRRMAWIHRIWGLEAQSKTDPEANQCEDQLEGGHEPQRQTCGCEGAFSCCEPNLGQAAHLRLTVTLQDRLRPDRANRRDRPSQDLIVMTGCQHDYILYCVQMEYLQYNTLPTRRGRSACRGPCREIPTALRTRLGE